MCKLNSINSFFILLIIVVLGISSVTAQGTDSIRIHPDMTLIKYSNGWLRSNNASGLYKLPVSNISLAEVSIEKNNGKFVNYYESNNDYNYGANAESFYRLGKKVVMYGNIGYSKFSGKNMLGSALINPYFNSFDIVEETETNRGKKESEKYHLVGAISAEIYSGLKLGGKVDYTAQNYAKFKDLRHRNELTDLALTIGASYDFIPQVSFGVNYYYRRSIEELYFNQYGNNEVTKPYMFINYGGFYGRREAFSNSSALAGVAMINTDIKPMVNMFHGGSVQIDWHINENFNFFNEFTYKTRTGYYGLETFIAYTEHESDILEYKGELTFKNKNDSHVLGLAIGQEKLKNYENNFIVDTEEQGGASFIKYAGKNLVQNKREYSVGVQYNGFLGIAKFVPLWSLKADVNFYERKGRTSLYPYYRKQDLHYMDLGIGGERNIMSGRNIYTIGLGLNYHFGDGTIKEDGVYADPGEGLPAPATINGYLNTEFEYLTASNASVDASFKYSRMINPNLWLYAGVSGSIRKGFEIQYIDGSSHVSTLIKIGCSF